MSRRPLHVLLLAYAFPPCSEIGTRRAVRFATGLGDLGRRVTVLTVEPRFHPLVDPQLVEQTRDIAVEATTTFDPLARWRARGHRAEDRDDPDEKPLRPAGAASLRRAPAMLRIASAALRTVLFPDPMIGWALPARRAARRVHARDPIDVILVTVPPHSALVPAAAIASDTGAKLVIDYRDPWAADRRFSGSSAPYVALADLLESRVLRRAALALFTSEPAREFYRERFPGLRTEVLYNGIDAYVESAGPASTPPLIWAHAGSLYHGRSLAGVVRALERAGAGADGRLEMIGDEPSDELALAAELGIADRVAWLGRRSVRSTLERLRRAHRLVAVISAMNPFSIPGKIFEYLSVLRPMLLLATGEHPAASIVRTMPSHRVLAPDDVAGITALLEEDARALAQGGLLDLDRSLTEPYEAAGQVGWLASWLDDL